MPAASSIYWNSQDSQRSSGNGSEPTSSSSDGRRRYVDPWDLENYAYLRRRQNGIGTPRDDDAPNVSSSPPHSNRSSSDSYYWYPMPMTRREPGYGAVFTSIEELYLRPSPRQMHQVNAFPTQQPSYDDETRYVTSNPVYVPLSDLDQYPEATHTMQEHYVPKVPPRRRNRLIKNMHNQREEISPCPFHGPFPDVVLARDASLTPPKQLGLNTYGHLRIDYDRSWNSLHRKMKK